MYPYKAPLRDIEFIAFELLDYEAHYAGLPDCSDLDRQLFQQILNEGAKFAEEILSPLNARGDSLGCVRHADGSVTTPPGFREAYQQYIGNGWNGLNSDVSWGGQGLPESLGTIVFELFVTANVSWAAGVKVSHGAVETVKHHGTEEQRGLFLEKFVAGTWTSAMGLTEPHCGSDLGMVRTRAEPRDDGSYRIAGTKIFTSGGEHDYCENIVHFVLARIPGSPPGSKGVSLFLVPKFQLSTDGSVSTCRNHVDCGSLETKMGMHGSPTCEMRFEAATGYLLGEVNRGLHCMFTFMNAMRLGAAVQGVAHAEAGLQQSQRYARERLQMRSLKGPVNPAGEADPIIVHPDVRRMLLTQKSFSEGGRMLIVMLARYSDTATRGTSSQERRHASDMLALLTPIAKAFLTEIGLESASHAIQCFGGHGYITETGVEQNYRDARAATLYEGTTGIQALDLLYRKVLAGDGRLLALFVEEVSVFCHADHAPQMRRMIEGLERAISGWQEMSELIAAKAAQDPDEIGAAAVDYLMYGGYTVLAYLWARAAVIAQQKRTEAGADPDGFYRAKLDTAAFYFARILPRTTMHKAASLAGAETLMSISETGFSYL
ncbi:MAG: acyl-CoA dehydrogenase C-terminal domain-containing protein [Halieaceae bacterium]|nr:acyl-CoA dehydrogenase C-terminal domain-containing protein [Halieaceae bacterium]MCP5205332.1 acyl-CoA dehydrogenase C-terminal domain-containing protein [Pseudomonadales bacterium]